MASQWLFWLAAAISLHTSCASTATVCADHLITEGMSAMADLDCLTDVKRCLQAGTCVDAGIPPMRLCECYRKVRLPLHGRKLSEYECYATEHAAHTVVEEWEACTSHGRADAREL